MERKKKGAPVEDETALEEEIKPEETETTEANPVAPVQDEPAVVEEPKEEEPPVEEPIAETSETEEPSGGRHEDNAGENTEVSMLTMWDLSERIWKAIKDKTDNWGYVAYWFPEQNMVWWKPENAASELDLICFVYSVMEDDTVVVDDGIPVKLTISVAEMQAELEKKDEAIAGAVAEIAELKGSLDALESFKAAFEQAEAERIEAEKAEQRANLKAYAIKSGLISEKDCETEEIAQMIEEIDEVGIKQVIASRYMESREVRPVVKTEGVMTASLTTEETKPVKGNAVMAYITR